MHFINDKYLKGLADGYLSYLKTQTQKNAHFHGLRDFYSLIQQVC